MTGADALRPLLAELVLELCDIGHADDLAALDGCADDATRALVVYDASTAVRLVDRRIHLRTACIFARNGAVALAAGARDEAQRWLTYASNDLERYRQKPEAERGATAEVSP